MKMINKFLKEFNKFPLRRKFVVIIIITILVPLLITTILMSVYIKNIMLEQAVSSVESTVSQISESIDETIVGQIYSISGLVADEYIYNLLTSEYSEGTVQKYMDTLRLSNKISSGYGRIYQDIHLAVIIGSNGTIFNLSLPSYENEELALVVNEIKESTRHIGTEIRWYGLMNNVFTNRVTGDIRQDRVIVAAMNIFVPTTGEYVGTQIYAMPEKLIYEKYEDTNLNEDGYICVFSRNGGLISSSQEEYVSGAMKLDEEYIGGVLSKPDKTYKMDADTLITTRGSQLNSWQTVGRIPVHVITGKVNELFNMFWAVILLSIGLCLSLFAVLSGAVMKPIKNIINSIEKFEMGEMESYVETSERSELGLLETHYNRMIDKINHHIVYEYELDKQKKQLELDVLMSQINSHFLSNALESIVWKARAAKSFDVEKMASSLGRFFKLSSKKGNVFVTVEEEVAHINAYVSIQKIRYGDKFEFFLTLDTENTPNIQELKTLKILLQPLVENSIMHALEGAEHMVTITVGIYVSGNKLIFEVCDNGVGISQRELEDIKDNIQSKNVKNKGIGLKNVRERIRLYFEEDYPGSDLVIESTEGEGTVIKLILPIIN